MSILFAVAGFGALGAASRYSVDTLIERHSESVFPWATFTTNVAGCLAVGFIIAALVDRERAPEWLQVGLVMGFCGGFTTFSTFAQETLDLVETRDLAIATANISASVLVGVLAVLLGVRMGRLV
jgi:fluoride exporter